MPATGLRSVELFAAELGLQPPATRVLWNRGYRDVSSARRFLSPSLDDLHDPMMLRGMPEALDRLRRAISLGQRILIYGDYDVDGATAIVILKKAIEMAGGTADFHVPHRLQDGYGMRPEVVERAAAEGVSLIISVDTGIRAGEVVRRATELGIDVIITDHHLPESQLPPALAVLNPNRPDCSYPEKNLCGVGVAFKLVQGLLRTMEWPAAKLQRVLESFLKLVAIGTVADVVPLTGENRIIVRHGLSGLSSVRNPGLRALLKVAGISQGSVPSAGQIAFRVAPRINAAGRMDTAKDAIELFLTGDDQRAGELAEQLHARNTERQQTETEIVNAILARCLEQPVSDTDATLVFDCEGWHRGVLGIVASRIVERFHRPAFVLSHTPEDGLAQGSGRGIPNFHLLEALQSMPELFLKFGGHMHAAGLTMQGRQVGEFRSRLNSYAAQRLCPQDFLSRLHIDAGLELREINDAAVLEVLSLEPFGCGNPAPIFAMSNVEVAGPPVVWKDKHLRVNLRQNDRILNLKAWNFADRAGEMTSGTRLDVVISFETDDYLRGRGFPGWTGVLRDVRPTQITDCRRD